MKKHILLALMLAASCSLGWSQQARSVKDAMTWWFDDNCGIGQEARFTALHNFADEAAPLLIQSYEAGPDQGWVDTRVQAEMRMVRANLEYVKKHPEGVAGLSKDELAEYQRMDLGSYEQELKQSLVANYKVAALNGLVITRTEAAKAYLTKLSTDRKSLDAPMARQLLERFGK